MSPFEMGATVQPLSMLTVNTAGFGRIDRSSGSGSPRTSRAPCPFRVSRFFGIAPSDGDLNAPPSRALIEPKLVRHALRRYASRVSQITDRQRFHRPHGLADARAAPWRRSLKQ